MSTLGSISSLGPAADTIPGLLARAAAQRGSDDYLRSGETVLSVAGLAVAVAQTMTDLRRLGVRPGDRVAVMLPNDPAHLVLILALMCLRAVWLPINPRLLGSPLARQLITGDPALLITTDELAGVVGAADPPASLRIRMITDLTVPTTSDVPLEQSDDPRADDVVAIMFTSGTTGPPKGVQVTDRMLLAAADSARLVSGVQEHDVLLVWEPLCHIGGAQMALVPLLAPVSLALVPGFRVSQFWTQAAYTGATHIHHLGGILSMLLSVPPHPGERAHRVRCSWGGGITEAVWRAAQDRFGVQVRECYGMTEAASICTANLIGPEHGVGRAIAPFQVEIRAPDGRRAGEGELGEIVVRASEPGVLTPGYFRDAAATAAARRDGWWHTGDLGREIAGDLHYAGRMGQSIRHRGENVSAWEVETIVNTHPAVAESAVVGVAAATGEQDLALFVTAADGMRPDPTEIRAWCGARMASYQVPDTVTVVASFARTPSQRIDKNVRVPPDAGRPGVRAAGR